LLESAKNLADTLPSVNRGSRVLSQERKREVGLMNFRYGDVEIGQSNHLYLYNYNLDNTAKPI